jgi:coenzyme F420-dependent glucose-6-phosphate dehydrogenase
MSEVRFGFHASHELYPPEALLQQAREAEAVGFRDGMSSDHFHPWSDRQGHSGNAWVWLGAALATTGMTFGVFHAPGQRYNAAVTAQAAATLARMFPGRFWLAVGSGENLNEHITGDPWPPKEERNARLRECVEVIRALWAGETVTHRGRIVVEDARLYDRPDEPPLIVGGALSEETARFVGGWADALITVGGTPDDLRGKVQAFREGGGEGKPMFLQVALSYAGDEETAWRDALRWGANTLGSPSVADLRMPQDFDARTRHVTREELGKTVRVSADVEQQLEWLRADIEQGFSRIYLHQIGTEHHRFLDEVASRLPELQRAGGPAGGGSR